MWLHAVIGRVFSHSTKLYFLISVSRSVNINLYVSYLDNILDKHNSGLFFLIFSDYHLFYEVCVLICYYVYHYVLYIMCLYMSLHNIVNEIFGFYFLQPEQR